MSDSEPVLYKLHDGVAIIQLNQPESLNAMNPELAHALVNAVERATAEARAIALFGSERAFCAGASLKSDRTKGDNSELDMGSYLEAIYNPFLKRLCELPIPLVIGVRGAAAGIGCSIALMGDIIVAGKSGFFLQAFCNVGLVPDGGAAYLLAKSIGRVRAMELMLLGERYAAERAYQDGLVTRVVEDDEVYQTTMDYATKLAAGPVIALGMIRQSAWAALDSSFAEQLRRDRENQLVAGRTEDFMEGAAAFRAKRKPVFKGE